MKYYRGIWLAAYIMANLIAAFVFGITGELDGDLIGYPLQDYSVLIVATIFVVGSYLIWMGYVFNIVSSIKVSELFARGEISGSAQEKRIIGIFVLIVQLGYMVFNYQQGANTAGSLQHSDSNVRYLWFLFVPDALFLVYYGLCRKSGLFAPNLFLYLLSNAMRGWLGTWLIVFFIEGAYRLREGRLNGKKTLILLTIFVAMLPVLIELKWMIRSGGTIHLNEIYTGLVSYIENMDWWGGLSDAIRPIVMRFQHLACVIGIIDHSTILSEGLANREYLYFFEEGLQPLEKLIGIAAVPDIHVTLLTHLIPEQLHANSITNTHVGLVGWLWLSPLLFPVYLYYLLLVSWLGMWLTKMAGGDGLLMEVLWFAWLGYLMNGWFGAYVEFMQALVVVICIRILISKVYQRVRV